MPTFIKAGFWKELCSPCTGYKGWLNLDEYFRVKAQAYYGSFYDTTTQIATINIPTPIKFNTTDISYGVSIQSDGFSNPTIIKIANSGVYNIQFSAQLEKQQGGGGTAKVISIWLKKNGTDVPWTTTFIGFVSNGVEAVAAWNFFVDALSGDEYQLMWLQDDDIHMIAIPANAHPATPSVILTVNKVSN